MKDKLSTIPINQEEIATYLKDIRKIKVMTVERERTLAQKILSDNITESEKKNRIVKIPINEPAIFAIKSL